MKRKLTSIEQAELIQYHESHTVEDTLTECFVRYGACVTPRTLRRWKKKFRTAPPIGRGIFSYCVIIYVL